MRRFIFGANLAASSHVRLSHQQIEVEFLFHRKLDWRSGEIGLGDGRRSYYAEHEREEYGGPEGVPHSVWIGINGGIGQSSVSAMARSSSASIS